MTIADDYDTAVRQRAKQHHYFCASCKDNWSTEHLREPGPCSHCEVDAVREIVVHLELASRGNPISDFDYRARFDDSDEESNECGFGATKRAAIADLIQNWGDA